MQGLIRLGVAMLALLLPCATRAADGGAGSIAIGYTAADSQSAFAAQDQGEFARRGLATSLVFVAQNSNIPALLASGSMQLGMTTVPVMLQAVDGGLDLVAIAGASAMAKETAGEYGVVSRAGLHHPADFVGRKVAVPGIEAPLHMLFRAWLSAGGVNPSRVTYVEATFTTMPDLLKAGTVDAVLALDPFLSRIAAIDPAYAVTSVADLLPGTEPLTIYVATRQWADSHRDQVAALRAAVAAGSDYVGAHPQEARLLVSQYTKLPMAILASARLPLSEAALSADRLVWWHQVMQDQHMLHGTLNLPALMAQ